MKKIAAPYIEDIIKSIGIIEKYLLEINSDIEKFY